MFSQYAVKVSRTVTKAVPSVASLSSVSVPSAARGKVSSSAVRQTGNSFKSFKEYREVAKTYGPLSAKLATQRHLAYPKGHHAWIYFFFFETGRIYAYTIRHRIITDRYLWIGECCLRTGVHSGPVYVSFFFIRYRDNDLMKWNRFLNSFFFIYNGFASSNKYVTN